MWEEDALLLKRFLTSDDPRHDGDLRNRAKRLEELFNPKVRGLGVRNWYPEPYQGDDGEPKFHKRTSHPVNPVEVDVDI